MCRGRLVNNLLVFFQPIAPSIADKRRLVGSTSRKEKAFTLCAETTQAFFSDIFCYDALLAVTEGGPLGRPLRRAVRGEQASQHHHTGEFHVSLRFFTVLTLPCDFNCGFWVDFRRFTSTFECEFNLEVLSWIFSFLFKIMSLVLRLSLSLGSGLWVVTLVFALIVNLSLNLGLSLTWRLSSRALERKLGFKWAWAWGQVWVSTSVLALNVNSSFNSGLGLSFELEV